MATIQKYNCPGRESYRRTGPLPACSPYIGPTQNGLRNTTGQVTFLLDRQLTAPWDAFIEYAGDFPERGTPQHILHFGTAYKLTAHQQVDFHVGAGLSAAAPAHFVGLGYSILLHSHTKRLPKRMVRRRGKLARIEA